jgi:hypothetical protein
MIIARKFRWSLYVVALVWAFSAIAALFVCPQCGYENPDSAEVCVHCGAALPAHPAAVETIKQTNTGPAAIVDNRWHMPANIVEKEIKLAMDNVKAGDVVVARLLFKNAMALDRITDPAVETNRAQRILEAIQKCDIEACNVMGKCPLCGGTGNKTVVILSMEGLPMAENLSTKSCAMCGGSGTVRKYADQDELKPVLGLGAGRYRMLQQTRKYVTVGNAWLPMSIEDKLSIHQIALLKSASAPPCDGCLGFCFVACPTCQGVAKAKCSNCVNGMMKVKTADGKYVTKKKNGAEQNVLKKCTTCGGSTMIACDKCSSTGEVMCNRCNGTGERPECKACDGKGLQPCKKCLGTGKLKEAVCPFCHGEGEILCPSCNGEGKKL